MPGPADLYFSGIFPAPLQRLLDAERATEVIENILKFSDVLEVQLRNPPHPPAAQHDPRAAFELLRSGSAMALLLRYRVGERVITDTFLRVPNGYRLVRLKRAH